MPAASHHQPRPPFSGHDRAGHDRALIHRILDAGRIAHVGFSVRARPYVLPMLYVRTGDRLLLHGNLGGRLLGLIGKGAQTCASVAVLDGLVVARSLPHHALNYRSVSVFGRAMPLVEHDEKAAALVGLVEALLPGRSGEARPAEASELASMAMLRLDIDDATAAVRSGPPLDCPDDLGLPFWAGELPLQALYGPVAAAPDLPPGLPLPDSLRRLLAMPAALPA